MRRRVWSVGVIASLLLVLTGIAAPPSSAAPPPSKVVTYDDLQVSARCAANGVGPLYTVTGQVAPKLPYVTATVQCTVNGQPTYASVPTLGALLPIPAAGPPGTTVGTALVLGDELRLCVIVDGTFTPPLLPAVPFHAERCA